ncbi:MAG: arylsulfatase [Reyranellaceae bacterium]
MSRRRPNVVVVILDDVGFADFGCYGSEIETPVIDRLAGRGLRYNSFRTTAICSCTRAALLTGLNHHSAGMGFLADYEGATPGYRGDLRADAGTMAETLRAAGYSTFLSGKWHVNSAKSLSQVGPMHNWPAQRGFERCYWFNGHSNDYFHPYDFYEGNSMVQVGGGEDYYLTDDLTDRAIAYIRDQQAIAPDKPFLLHLAYNAAHSPLHARAADRDKYRGRYDAGWDEIRAARLARQIELGVVPAGTRLPPHNEGVRPWADLSDEERRAYARYMEVYAGVIDRVDWNLGRLVATLEELGQLDDTLLFLFSDNGASAEGTPTGTPNLMLTAYAQPPSLEEALGLYDVMGGPETFPHYPRGWAMASNTPFRMYKQYTFLGGICDPLVVHWPNGTTATGGVRPQYAHAIDIYPTVLEAAGLAPPTERLGKPCKPIEGVSFAASFGDPDVPSRHVAQYYEIGGQRAMYADGWHIVAWHKRGRPFDKDRWELYRPASDFNEMDDLAARYPEKVKELEALWYAAAERFDVLPLDDRNFWLKIIESRRHSSQHAHWEVRPPVQPISSHVAPLTGGRSHVITVKLERPTGTEDGVLVAYGSRAYGFALYVQDGHLVYEIGLAPRSHVLRSSRPLPAGRQTVRFEMEMIERPLRGVGRLLVDGEEIGRRAFDEVMVGVPYDGLDIGADRNAPVSGRYRAPFAFQGPLHRVAFDVDTAPPTEEELKRDARMIQMMS